MIRNSGYIRKRLSGGFFCLLAIGLTIVVTLIFSCRDSGHSARIFEDVTFHSGLSYIGMTFGAAWGDLDGDDLPDLYLTNHYNPGTLYRNLGNGQFEDVTGKYFMPEDLSGDKHGSVWADFDNDGDQDLLVLRGGGRGVGAEPNHLYVNTGSRFEEKGREAGISNPATRARMPLACDFNRDGLLDLFLGALGRKDGLSPPGIFIQEDNGKFSESKEMVTFSTQDVPFGIITELNNDDYLDFVCRVQAPDRTAHVFSTAKIPFAELNLMPRSHYDDIAAGDFNGDLLLDLYLARKLPDRAATILGNHGVNQIAADMKIDQGKSSEKVGFTFRSTGNLTFQVRPEQKDFLSPDQVFIGSTGIHPKEYTFDLSTEISGIQGSAPYHPGRQTGLYISLTSSDKWQILFSIDGDIISGDTEKSRQVDIKITSSEAITELEAVGETSKFEQPPDRLLINRSLKMEEEGNRWKINKTLSASVNVVAGDFDNDMDLDLYIVASGGVANQENKLLLNQGDGHFETVPGAGGAPGSRWGVGDSVVTADYDLDGFLDLLVANGGSMGRCWGLPSEDGRYQLYHNLGNDNHWIEIDLEGTTSNRDGVGARVYISAGGITQVRIQDGGIHNRGQNHQRIHFGLGKHTQADMVKIHWPSGTVQELNNVAADQLIRIKES